MAITISSGAMTAANQAAQMQMIATDQMQARAIYEQIAASSRRFSGPMPYGAMQYAAAPWSQYAMAGQMAFGPVAPMPWMQPPSWSQNPWLTSAYQNSAYGPDTGPAFRPNPWSSPMGQANQINSWSYRNGGQNGITPFTTVRQDAATNDQWTRLTEQSADQLLDNVKGHPEDKFMQRQIWDQVNSRAAEMEAQGIPVSSGQRMMWNAQLISNAAAEGLIAQDTGAYARQYMKVANSGNQAMADMFLKGGQPLPMDLMPYYGTSMFR